MKLGTHEERIDAIERTFDECNDAGMKLAAVELASRLTMQHESLRRYGSDVTASSYGAKVQAQSSSH